MGQYTILLSFELEYELHVETLIITNIWSYNWQF